VDRTELHRAEGRLKVVVRVRIKDGDAVALLDSAVLALRANRSARSPNSA